MTDISRNRKRTTKDMWKTIPIAENADQLPANKLYHLEQWDQISRGLMPEEMEDKWFIYEENYWVYFHRSWTGICIFKAHFSIQGENLVLDEAFVDAETLGENLVRKDRYQDFLYWLVDHFLLGKDIPFRD